MSVCFNARVLLVVKLGCIIKYGENYGRKQKNQNRSGCGKRFLRRSDKLRFEFLPKHRQGKVFL